MVRRFGRFRGPGILAAVLILMATLSAGCARRVNVDVEGGSASGVDWRIGIPF